MNGENRSHSQQDLSYTSGMTRIGWHGIYVDVDAFIDIDERAELGDLAEDMPAGS